LLSALPRSLLSRVYQGRNPRPPICLHICRTGEFLPLELMFSPGPGIMIVGGGPPLPSNFGLLWLPRPAQLPRDPDATSLSSDSLHAGRLTTQFLVLSIRWGRRARSSSFLATLISRLLRVMILVSTQSFLAPLTPDCDPAQTLAPP